MTCIKCGREVAEGELFCTECSKMPSAVAVAAEPTKKATSAQKAAAKPTAKKERKPVGLIAAFVLVLLIALTSVGYIAYDRLIAGNKYAELTRAQTELAQAESRYTLLSQELERANDQLSTYQMQIDTLQSEIDSLERQLSTSEGSATQSRFDLSEQKLEYDELLQVYTALAEEADRLTSALSVTEADLAAAAERITILSEDLTELRTENANLSESVAFYEAYAVFIPVGKPTYYHRRDCVEVSSDNFWIYNKKLAETKGYKPCPLCFE